VFFHLCLYLGKVYARGKFKLSKFIRDRDYVIYKLNHSCISDAILEDLREKEMIQKEYTFFYHVLTPQGLIKVYQILSMREWVCVCVCIYMQTIT